MKEILKIIKVQLQAGKATAAPPLGPILTSCQIIPNTFVKDFNEKTSKLNGLLSARIFIFKDKTFDFVILTKPISRLILDTLNLKSGSDSSKKIIYKMNTEELLNIIKLKKTDFPFLSDESLSNMILGTAKNMGITL